MKVTSLHRSALPLRLVSSRRLYHHVELFVYDPIFPRRVMSPARWASSCSLRHHSTVASSSMFAAEATFESLGLAKSPRLLKALSTMGIHTPTKVQSYVIPPLLKGENVVCTGETGSGKTLSYLLPILLRMMHERDVASKQTLKSAHGAVAELHYPKAVILVPNRELCAQLARMIDELNAALEATSPSSCIPTSASVPISFSSTSSSQEVSKNLPFIRYRTLVGSQIFPPHDHPSLTLSDGADIAIGTPTAMMANVKRLEEVPAARARPFHSHLFRNLQWLILDEADLVLTGASEKVSKNIVEWTQHHSNGNVQFVFTGATLPERGMGVHNYLQFAFPPSTLSTSSSVRSSPSRSPRAAPSPATAVWIKDPNSHAYKSTVKHTFTFVTDDQEKREAIRRLLQMDGKDKGRTIVFMNSAERAQSLSEYLQTFALQCRPFHKNVPAAEREQTMRDFAHGSFPILVSTNLAARGIDIPDVSLVVEGDVKDVVTLLHRSGRAGRAKQVSTQQDTKQGVQTVEQVHASSTVGQVVSFYVEGEKELVRYLERQLQEQASTELGDAEVADGPAKRKNFIELAFSHRRSFNRYSRGRKEKEKERSNREKENQMEEINI